jgi:hypothetical protein
MSIDIQDQNIGKLGKIVTNIVGAFASAQVCL